ncbi:ABC transporter ATP-binding protein [Lichenihabitans sp. Uapishka_5]|uniref:ABC transporter ATP-binding protein n=1 Tax=Lichenihabitans sp. Uapishka_5 TaxID=3037302 RepID=UPI0029E7E2BA|nr:ABC transporter ATP-binding protein [Lichenihabitans sp. Uapishka_5]MDX7950837.1 ABC transporter ATP-binding protein [Lichenihabitans sp. Uapishka_5]
MSVLLDARNLSKRYPVRHGGRTGQLHAVDDVDLAIAEGECVGLVGESGCGKSTIARLAARLLEPSAGRLLFAGTDIGAVPLRRFTTRPERAAIQVVFQDPTESLNPGFTVFAAVADPVRHLLGTGNAAAVEARVWRAIDDVGLPRALAQRYPHQLSGGQKARVGIARAIAVEPRLLILDEPTSALDVSVQSVVLKLLGELRTRRRMSYLFVSHDLDVVRLICDRIAVMYLGKIIEIGTTESLLRVPAHPYTRALLAATPDPKRRGLQIARLAGTATSPIDPDPNSCRFAGRCPLEFSRCSVEMPALRPLATDQAAACHLAGVLP